MPVSVPMGRMASGSFAAAPTAMTATALIPVSRLVWLTNLSPLKARGAAGIVTDGGFRDTNGVFKTGLPAYHRRPSSPPSPIAHRPVDLNLPIACGGVAVYPGDIVVGDRDAILVIPPDIVEAVAQEALDTYHYEEFAEAEVARGRSLKGLFPAAGEEAKRDYEAWKKKKG